MTNPISSSNVTVLRTFNFQLMKRIKDQNQAKPIVQLHASNAIITGTAGKYVCHVTIIINNKAAPNSRH